MWTVGVMAKKAGVNIETLRYYERLKLLAQPPRKASGYRLYDEQSLERLHFIRRMQNLGFTLSEIRELLDLSLASPKPCAEVCEKAQYKLADIRNKISELERMRDALAKLIRQCRADGKTNGPCPILKGGT